MADHAGIDPAAIGDGLVEYRLPFAHSYQYKFRHHGQILKICAGDAFSRCGNDPASEGIAESLFIHSAVHSAKCPDSIIVKDVGRQMDLGRQGTVIRLVLVRRIVDHYSLVIVTCPLVGMAGHVDHVGDAGHEVFNLSALGSVASG